MIPMKARIQIWKYNSKMQIEETINKWFEQTFEKFQKEVHPPTEDDLLLAGVLFTSRKYVRTVLLLLAQKHSLPAKALLRILCELFVKILWCLNVRGDTAEIKQAVHNNFQRWDYLRLIQDKKLLEKLAKSATGDFKIKVQRSLKKADSDFEKYKKRGVKRMPDTASLFEVLSRDESAMNLIYPKVYQNYNRAVHLDRNTFSRLVRHEGDRIVCYDDWDDDINDLYANCSCMACDINILIRKYFDWPVDAIRQECLNLTSKYEN